MPRKITSVEVLNAPDDVSAQSEGGVSNIITSGILERYPDVVYRLRDVGEMTLRLTPGSDWMKAAATGDQFTEDQTIRITYDDASESYWRVIERQVDHAGARASVVKCWPYWTMLDRRIVRTTRGTKTDPTLALVGLTVSEALSVITGSGYNAPPYFQAGTVATAFSSVEVNIEANGESHLDLLWRLMDDLAYSNAGSPAEFEIAWNSGDSKFDINVKTAIGLTAAEESGGADPSLRPIDAPATGSKGNRVSMIERTNATDFFNRIIPLSGTEEEPVTIGQAYFNINNGSQVSGDSEMSIKDGIDPFFGDLDLTGYYFGNEDDGFHLVVSMDDQNTFYLDGLVTLLYGRFALDAQGTELAFIEDTTASSENAVREKMYVFDDIAPFSNEMMFGVPDTGNKASADMSGTWISGEPPGWDAIDAATFTEVTDDQYVRFGTSSAQVSASAGDGMEAVITIRPTPENPYYSMYVNLYVVQGQVEIVLIDGNGTEWPTGTEKARSNAREMRSLSIGGMAPLNSAGGISQHDCTVQIRAVDDNTVFVVDSIALTRSTYPVPYRAKMGLHHVFRAGAEILSRFGGKVSDFSGQLFDVTHFDAGSYEEIVVGSWVRFRDQWNGSSFDVSVDARVVELQESEDPVEGRVVKRIKLSTDRQSLSNRLLTRRPGANLPAAAPVPDAVTSAGGTVSQSYYIGDRTGADILSTIDVPLRAAPSNLTILSAYVINAVERAADGTNYTTVDLRNYTRGISIGSVSNESAAFGELATVPITIDNPQVYKDDVLHVRLTAAGTGTMLDNMVIVLETSAAGASLPPVDAEDYETLYVATDSQLFSVARDDGNEPWTATEITPATAFDTILAMRADVSAGYVFTLELNGGTFSLKRRDLDGTNLSTLYTFTDSSEGFDLDRVNQRVYFDEYTATSGVDLKSIAYAGGSVSSEWSSASGTARLQFLSYDSENEAIYLRYRNVTNPNQADEMYRFDLSDLSTAVDIGDFSEGNMNGMGYADGFNGYWWLYDGGDSDLSYVPIPSGGGRTTFVSSASDNGIFVDPVGREVIYGDNAGQIWRKSFITGNEVLCVDDIAGDSSSIISICAGVN